MPGRHGVLTLAALLVAVTAAFADPIVIDFEGIADQTSINSQYPGLLFSKATVITAGISLNEREFPPHSGRNVVFDDGGPVSIVFDTPVLSVGGYFTYDAPLTLQAFDLLDNPLPVVLSMFSDNLALTGDLGSSPNEFLRVAFAGGISRLVISGAPNGTSFTTDDLTLEAVPEPSTIFLLGSGLGLVSAYRRRRSAVSALRAIMAASDKGLPGGQSVILVLISLLAPIQVARAQTLEPSVALPAVNPAAVAAGAGPLITVSASISYPDDTPVIPDSVNLLQIDDQGQASIIGRLNDDGVDGDAAAGDSVFTGQVILPAHAPGLIRLQVSAGFRHRLLRVRSDITSAEVFPPGVPLRHQPPDLSSPNICTDVSGSQFLCNEILMLFNPGADFDEEVEPAAASVGGTVVGLISFPWLNIWEVQVPCSTASCVGTAVDTLLQEVASGTFADLAGAEPDFLTFPDQNPVVPNDPRFPLQWGPPKVQLPLAWSFTTGQIIPLPTSVPLIAIVDSGIDVTHGDLPLNTKVKLGSNWINPATGGTPSNDQCGHGTAVAGIAGAVGNNGFAIAGGSWSAFLIAIKAFAPAADGRCLSTTAAVAAAFKEAVDLGGTAINASAGGLGRTETEASAVQYINRANRVLIAAAGNGGSNVREYPAGFNERECFGTPQRCYTSSVLSVGATERDDTRSGFSSYGTWVRIYAPGSCILSTVRAVDPTAMAGDPCLMGAAPPPAGDRLNFFGGTSVATPLVSGTASLMISARPNGGGAFAFGNIRDLADDTGNNDPDGNRMMRLNAFRAVRCAATNVCQ